MELVSIIVPVYNVQDQLRRCVESIICQDYSNIEIFLIDDGATDKSGDICDEYSKQDNRICVIHKANGGLSDARNVALDKCTGDWICFIDSDDYVDKNYVSEMINVGLEKKADIVVSGRIEVYENSKETTFLSEKYRIWNSLESLKSLATYDGIHVGAWGKLYKRYIFEEIRYPKGVVSEDVAIATDIFSKARKVVHTGQASYYYVHRQGSLSKAFNPKQLSALESYIGFKKDLLTVYPQLKKEADYYCLKGIMSLINMYFAGKLAGNSNQDSNFAYKKIVKKLTEFGISPCSNPYMSVYDKVIYIMYCTRLYYPLRRIKKMISHK